MVTSAEFTSTSYRRITPAAIKTVTQVSERDVADIWKQDKKNVEITPSVGIKTVDEDDRGDPNQSSLKLRISRTAFGFE